MMIYAHKLVMSSFLSIFMATYSKDHDLWQKVFAVYQRSLDEAESEIRILFDKNRKIRNPVSEIGK